MMAIIEGAGSASPVSVNTQFNQILFKKISDNSIIPTRAHSTDAGFDLYCSEDVLINPGEQQMVSTGIAVALPLNTVGLVCPRSGLAAKNRITITNAPGIVDSGYRGEIKVILQNTGSSQFSCASGSRVAQLVVVPYFGNAVEVEDLPPADRGLNGFGSSGT